MGAPRQVTPADLRAWRDRQGLRQADLADLLGVHAMTVSRWERGPQKIPPYLGLALEALEQRATTEGP